MATAIKTATRNAIVQDVIDAIGSTAVLEIYSGAKTGKTTGTFNADPTGKLASIPLPSPPFGTPSGGVAALANGPWTASASDGSNTVPVSWRIKTEADGDVSTVVAEGDVTVNGDPATSLSLATNITAGQTISVSTFNITAGNA